mgnify:CR=1 FL=1
MFEAYKKPNLVHKFSKAPKTEMEFRFPTSENDRDLERFLETHPTLLEAKIYQLSLLFVGTKLMRDEVSSKTDERVPIMEESDPVVMKMDIFMAMPVGMIDELHDALMAYYPDWKLTE